MIDKLADRFLARVFAAFTLLTPAADRHDLQGEQNNNYTLPIAQIASLIEVVSRHYMRVITRNSQHDSCAGDIDHEAVTQSWH